MVVHLHAQLQVDECCEVGQKTCFLLKLFGILNFSPEIFKTEDFIQKGVF